MAAGKNVWVRRTFLLSAIFLYAALLAADIAPNPFPGIWDWIGRDRPLAPDLAWQERLGARPGSAAVAGDAVAVNAGGRVELRERSSGDLRGPGDPPQWPAEWVGVAGEGDSTVVVTSEGTDSGYQLRDPGTGTVLHEVPDAMAVWTFRDGRLDLRCDDGRACTLRAYPPAGQTPIWTTDLPGQREGMLGLNPQLAGARMPDTTRIDTEVGRPVPMPRVLGFPVERRDGDAVVVVAMGSGEVLRILEPSGGERVMVVGDRVVRTTTTRQNGICLASAAGHDAASGSRVWGPEPYHVWSIEACEQRDPPVAAGAAMVVVGPEGRPIVLDAYDGRVLWRGEAEESVVGLSRDLAMIRAGDETTLYAVVLGGDGEPRWERRAEPDAEVLIGPCGVVVSDRDPNRIYVWDPVTGENLLSAASSARVLACAPDGVVLTGGRSVGFVSFGGASGDSDGGSREPVDSK